MIQAIKNKYDVLNNDIKFAKWKMGSLYNIPCPPPPTNKFECNTELKDDHYNSYFNIDERWHNFCD